MTAKEAYQMHIDYIKKVTETELQDIYEAIKTYANSNNTCIYTQILEQDTIKILQNQGYILTPEKEYDSENIVPDRYKISWDLSEIN